MHVPFKCANFPKKCTSVWHVTLCFFVLFHCLFFSWPRDLMQFSIFIPHGYRSLLQLAEISCNVPFQPEDLSQRKQTDIMPSLQLPDTLEQTCTNIANQACSAVFKTLERQPTLRTQFAFCSTATALVGQFRWRPRKTTWSVNKGQHLCRSSMKA